MSILVALLTSIVDPLISRRSLNSNERKNLQNVLDLHNHSNQDPRDTVEAETLAVLLPHFQQALHNDPKDGIVEPNAQAIHQ
ncbi:hypothetical protein C8R43DRAFT_1015206 [Mycena crocata]|nr:hypothetical protein C8R43DRAFT_1015206 [Mycena crocata]